jgi:hypothetical protein
LQQFKLNGSLNPQTTEVGRSHNLARNVTQSLQSVTSHFSSQQTPRITVCCKMLQKVARPRGSSIVRRRNHQPCAIEREGIFEKDGGSWSSVCDFRLITPFAPTAGHRPRGWDAVKMGRGGLVSGSAAASSLRKLIRGPPLPLPLVFLVLRRMVRYGAIRAIRCSDLCDTALITHRWRSL